MSLAKYSCYEAIEAKGINRKPEHWNASRLRFAATLNPSKQEAKGLGEQEMVSFLPMEAIGEDGRLRLEYEKELGECLSGYTYFRDGDVCIAKITPCFENGKGAILRGLKGGLGFGTTELIVARPREEKITAEFLDYLFRSQVFRSLGESEMYGAGGQKRVPDSFVRDFVALIPSTDEQKQVTNFLDRETAKIDALIAEQRRLIELLQEKRQAVISYAVAKGLNPDAPMKDSGVEWLGEVPEHWEVKKLRYVCKIQTGSRDTEEAVEDGEYSFFVRSQTVERINSYTYDCEAVLTAGDGAGVGKVFHYYAGPFDFHQRVYMLNEFNGIHGKLIYHFLKTNFFKVALQGGAKSTVDSLRRPMFTGFPVCIPPKDEQGALLEHVETEEEKIGKLMATSEQAVSLLQERRSALISAAVTGQIDVRGLVKVEACEQ